MSTVVGCAIVRDVRPDGSYTEYRRLGNQSIKRVEIRRPDGTVAIVENQLSLNNEFAERITKGVIKGLIQGAKGL